jgi:hypothetical protein
MTTTYTYPDAIIYRIVCNETGEIYIGSTVGRLADRMHRHRSDTKRYNTWVADGSIGKRPRYFCCSMQILNRGKYCVFQIETSPCNTLSELCLREGIIQIQYKKDIGALCINISIAGALARAGGKVNYNKQYYTENADTIREHNKQYKQTNATKIATRQGVKHDCSVCAGKYTHGNRAHHFKSQKHQRAMQSDT